MVGIGGAHPLHIPSSPTNIPVPPPPSCRRRPVPRRRARLPRPTTIPHHHPTQHSTVRAREGTSPRTPIRGRYPGDGRGYHHNPHPQTNPRRQPPPEPSSLNRPSGPRFGTHTPTVLPHPDAVSMVGPGRRTPSHHPCRHTERFFLSFRAKPRNLNRCSAFAAPFTNTPVPPPPSCRRRPVPRRRARLPPQSSPPTNPRRQPPPEPSPLPPSYRTPMRYPWWGPGGAHPRTTLAVIPSAFFCHSERSRRTSRPHYAHPRTTPTHYRQATHHHHLFIPDPDPVPTGPGRCAATSDQSPGTTDRRPTTTTSSSPTPIRYPWGPGGARPPPTNHQAQPTGDPPPPRRTGPRFGTHTATVLPHSDAVSMVGTPPATDPLDVRAFPPLSHHHGFRFSPERRGR